MPESSEATAISSSAGTGTPNTGREQRTLLQNARGRCQSRRGQGRNRGRRVINGELMKQRLSAILYTTSSIISPSAASMDNDAPRLAARYAIVGGEIVSADAVPKSNVAIMVSA